MHLPQPTKSLKHELKRNLEFYYGDGKEDVQRLYDAEDVRRGEEKDFTQNPGESLDIRGYLTACSRCKLRCDIVKKDAQT